MNGFDNIEDIGKLIDNAQAIITRDTKDQILKKRNLDFLVKLGSVMKADISDGIIIDSEKLKIIISGIIKEVIGDKNTQEACDELGLGFKQLDSVSKAFIIPELSGRSVFISGTFLDENETIEMRIEKNRLALIQDGTRLWCARILQAGALANDPLKITKSYYGIQIDNGTEAKKGPEKIMESISGGTSLEEQASDKLETELLDESGISMDSLIEHVKAFGIGIDASKKEEPIIMEEEKIFDPYAEELPIFKKRVEDARGELEELFGIKEKDGIWYMKDFLLSPSNAWRQRIIGKLGKKLNNFPYKEFNVWYSIGNEEGELIEKQDIAVVFEKLGLKIANDEQEAVYTKSNELQTEALVLSSEIIIEKPVEVLNEIAKKATKKRRKIKPSPFCRKDWGNPEKHSAISSYCRKQLEDNKDEIEEKTGILIENDKVYFLYAYRYGVSWTNNHIEGLGKFLKNFPNAIFNRHYGIGNHLGEIRTEEDLKNMFQIIGYSIADENEKKEKLDLVLAKRYDKMKDDFRFSILSSKEELEEKTGIILSGKTLYFFDSNGSSKRSWHNCKIEALGKKLSSYPDQVYNRFYGLGDDSGKLKNLSELKEMFFSLGFKIADKVQERDMLLKKYSPTWRNKISTQKKELEKNAGIVENNGIWYFSGCTGNEFWPEIDGINLMSFPSCSYNIMLGIGNDSGQIKNPKQLKKLFEIIGLRIATDHEEILFKEDLLKENCLIWKQQLFDHKEVLENEAGIIEEEGIWYFCNARSKSNWPKIGGKSLRSFTNQAFREKHSIGLERRELEHIVELKIMFEGLGCVIADNHQENLMYMKIKQKKKSLKNK